MLIDVSKLKPTLTYHVNEIGTGRTSLILQDLQHLEYKNIKKENIATHSLILFNKLGNWMVFENHLKWKGTRQYTLAEYEKINIHEKKRVEIHPYKFDLHMVEYLTRNNPGYQVLDLAEIAIKRLAGLPFPSFKGLVCSSTVAQCGVMACNTLGLKMEEFSPADWQYYFSL